MSFNIREVPLKEIQSEGFHSKGNRVPRTDEDIDSDNGTSADGVNVSVEDDDAVSHDHETKRKKVGPKLTAFLLLNAMIGAGILNVPYTFRQSGIVLGCCIFLFFGFLTWFSLLLLIHTGIVSKKMDYGELAFAACGKKGEVCVDLWTVLEGVGGCLGYLVIIGANMSSVLQNWIGSDDDWYASYYFLTCAFLVVFMLPLTFIRQFGHFAWISVRQQVYLTNLHHSC